MKCPKCNNGTMLAESPLTGLRPKDDGSLLIHLHCVCEYDCFVTYQPVKYLGPENVVHNIPALTGQGTGQ